jgi:hypothetical protein
MLTEKLVAVTAVKSILKPEIRPIRFAYTNPPYPSCARKHYINNHSGIAPQEVNHSELIAHWMKFDAWALSKHTPALLDILHSPHESTYDTSARQLLDSISIRTPEF